jgi:hypothetical protein
MIQAPFFYAKDNAQVQALLGPGPIRLWPAGRATQNSPRPYAVFQLVYGNPDNSLSCIPKEDLLGYQVDVYAKTASDAWDVAFALRDVYEAGYNQIVSWNNDEVEPATSLYRVGFTVEFWERRQAS